MSLALLCLLIGQTLASGAGYRTGFQYISVRAYTKEAQIDDGYKNAYLSITCRAGETIDFIVTDDFIITTYPDKNIESQKFDIDEETFHLRDEHFGFGLKVDKDADGDALNAIDYEDDIQYVECKIEVKIRADAVLASTGWINLNQYEDYHQCKEDKHDGLPQGFDMANSVAKSRKMIAAVTDWPYNVIVINKKLARDEQSEKLIAQLMKDNPDGGFFVIGAQIPLVCSLND